MGDRKKSKNRRNYRHRDQRRTRTLRVEPLESRDLLSINLVGEELQILGTSGNDYASVAWRSHDAWTEDGARVEVWGISDYLEVVLNDEVREMHFYDYSPDLVEPVKIVFYGYGGNDRFVNQTGKPSEAYGGPGRDKLYGGSSGDLLVGGPGVDKLYGQGGSDELYAEDESGSATEASERVYDRRLNARVCDYLYGGGGGDLLVGGPGADYLAGGRGSDELCGEAGEDLLFGEKGRDTLRGGPGDDHLMGGEGRDTLEGGEGSDGLFGGVDAVRDTLSGDRGSGVWDEDRFLTRPLDVASDLCPSDVEICISDGSSPWTDREVLYLDQDLASLQEFAQSTLILKDTVGTLPIEFEQETPDFFGSASTWGRNDRPWQDDDGLWHRTIHLKEGFVSHDWVVTHELAHNWDSADESDAHPTGLDYWDGFEDLFDPAGPLNDFARSYGRTNAKEDWATCWELHKRDPTFGADGDRRVISDTLKEKLAIVRSFFEEIELWSTDTSGFITLSMASAWAESDDHEAKSLAASTDLMCELKFGQV